MNQENIVSYEGLLRDFGLKSIPDASSVIFRGKQYFREFYLDDDFLNEHALRPGKHPYHEAGLYYMQSPEAMHVVAKLQIRPYDRVIDLCASPGGKATQAADMLSLSQGGFLLANEYIGLRARTLSSNFERMGIRNGAVLNENTERIAERFPEYFTRVIVDAPCSGEGMFRKDPETIRAWSPESVAMCALRQREIVRNAVFMLAPGGRMSYSTCTFEREENEDIVNYILAEFPEMQCIYMKRHWPHQDRGEGHFCAILKKSGEDLFKDRAISAEVMTENSALLSISEEEIRQEADLSVGFTEERKKDQVYLVPDCLPDLRGLKVFRKGILKEEILKNREEPSHAYVHALPPMQTEFPVVNYKKEDPRIDQYLHGLQITVPDGFDGKGFVIVACDGAYLGLGKCAGTQIKNHFPKGLRFL